MRECEICGKFEELLNTVIEGRPVETCRNCAEMHNAIILTMPSEEKLKNVERIFSVRERLEEASKLKEKAKAQQIKEMEEKKAFPDTISYRLRKAREMAGLSKERLADELGLSKEQIEKIEKGEKPLPQTLRRYEQFFKKEFKTEETQGTEEGKINFRDEKITLKDLLHKAKTFFTGKKFDDVIAQENVEKEEKPEGKSKEKIEIIENEN